MLCGGALEEFVHKHMPADIQLGMRQIEELVAATDRLVLIRGSKSEQVHVCISGKDQSIWINPQSGVKVTWNLSIEGQTLVYTPELTIYIHGRRTYPGIGEIICQLANIPIVRVLLKEPVYMLPILQQESGALAVSTPRTYYLSEAPVVLKAFYDQEIRTIMEANSASRAST